MTSFLIIFYFRTILSFIATYTLTFSFFAYSSSMTAVYTRSSFTGVTPIPLITVANSFIAFSFMIAIIDTFFLLAAKSKVPRITFDFSFCCKSPMFDISFTTVYAFKSNVTFAFSFNALSSI